MASHHPSKDVIAEAVDQEIAGDPFDQTAKDTIIAACLAAAKAALTAATYTEASDSLAVTIDGSGVMWFDYNHDATPYRCQAPLAPGHHALVGGDDS